MDARKFVAAWNTFWQLHRELQTYTDAEIAELNLTRRDGVRVAFAAAVAVYGTAATPTECPLSDHLALLAA